MSNMPPGFDDGNFMSFDEAMAQSITDEIREATGRNMADAVLLDAVKATVPYVNGFDKHSSRPAFAVGLCGDTYLAYQKTGPGERGYRTEKVPQDTAMAVWAQGPDYIQRWN